MSSKEFFAKYTFGCQGNHASVVLRRTPTPRPTEFAPTSLDMSHYCTPSEWRALLRGPEFNLEIMPGTFCFLSLPGEIRNMVYRELLLTTIPLQLIQNCPLWPDIDFPGKKIHPVILRINKRIHAEAASILYGENTWYVHIDEPVKTFQRMKFGGSGFALPPPLTLYMHSIRRVIVYSDLIYHVRSRPDLANQLLAIGIHLNNLQLFAINFPDLVRDLNKNANEHWLTEKSESELAENYVWFPAGFFHSAWLVKKKKSENTNIPGLGVF